MPVEIDTSGIDGAQLARQLDAEYGLGITSVAFVPKGEEAYSYIATGRASGRHFVRAQRTASAAGLEAAFAVTGALHIRCGLRQVVTPYPNRCGSFTCRHAGYTVAVFPFVEGTTAYERDLSDEGLAQAASLVAAIHTSGRSCSLPLARRETFENPFEGPILRALHAAVDPGPQANAHQRRVRRLLVAEQADILAALGTMRRLQAAARRLDFGWVLTHGDPNLANFLIDAQDDLHLTDWGEVALGPPERDLFHFTGERFERFLRHYLTAVGQVHLHEGLFAFYIWRWTLQEIADYTTRILFRNSDPREDQHAWEELAPYLPIRHADLHADLRAAWEVVHRVSGDWARSARREPV